MKRISRLGRAAAMALAAGLFLAACDQDEAPQEDGGAQERPPHPAEVVELSRQDIALDKSYSAMLRSDDEVTLVARVTGTLEERHFEPGELVEQGQVLYSIEPDVYQAEVNQREADLQSARAELERAQRDAERFERLLSQNSVSRQQYDQARAELGVARAAVAQAEAALASSGINLDYTEVSAPVSGMISLSQVNVGNLVSNGTELATITPLDPLEVRFQLPQRDAFELRQQQRENAEAVITAVLEFPAVSGRDAMTLEGELDFLGSRVSEGTSTVQASAVFENPDGLFLPGQYVRVRLEGMKRFDVLAVPEIAVTQGLMGPQVFVLDEENVVGSRNVIVGETAGAWEIISEGLEPGDRVIVSDPGAIEPGMVIDPQPFDGNAERLSAEQEQQAQEGVEELAEFEEAVEQEAPEADAEGN